MTRIKTNHDMFAARGDRWDIHKPRPPKPRFGIKVITFKDGRDPVIVDQTKKYEQELAEYQASLDNDGDPDLDRWLHAGYAKPSRQKRKASITSSRPSKPAPKAMPEGIIHARKAASILARYRAGKFANFVKVKE